jgi:hypothetical protein
MAEPDPAPPLADRVVGGGEQAGEVVQAGTARQQQAGSSSGKRPMHESSIQNLQPKPCKQKDANGQPCEGKISSRWVCSSSALHCSIALTHTQHHQRCDTH